MAAAAVGGAGAGAGPRVPRLDELPRGSNVALAEVDPFGAEGPLTKWAENRFQHTIPTRVPVKVLMPGEEPQFLYEPISELTNKPFVFPEGYIFLASAEPTRYFVGPSKYIVRRPGARRNSRRARRRASRRRASRRRTSNRR